MKEISSLAKGDTMPLVVRYNGEQVGTRISVLPEQGRSISLSTTPRRAAALTLPVSGRYLATAAYKGKTCSLTFSIREPGGEG